MCTFIILLTYLFIYSQLFGGFSLWIICASSTGESREILRILWGVEK
jgi:hypothetical protein